MKSRKDKTFNSTRLTHDNVLNLIKSPDDIIKVMLVKKKDVRVGEEFNTIKLQFKACFHYNSERRQNVAKLKSRKFVMERNNVGTRRLKFSENKGLGSCLTINCKDSKGFSEKGTARHSYYDMTCKGNSIHKSHEKRHSSITRGISNGGVRSTKRDVTGSVDNKRIRNMYYEVRGSQDVPKFNINSLLYKFKRNK